MPVEPADHLTTVAARAPGRVNLIGEHLDYNAGLCLPVALSLGTTARASPLPAGAVELRSGDRPSGWPAYVLGVLAELEVPDGVRLLISSQVPIGAGLSSSAALECSVALAVNELFGLNLTRTALAAACQRAENDHVGAPTGGMDQLAALFALPGHALLLDFATDARTPVRFDPGGAGLELRVYDTGTTHELAAGQYAVRRSQCADAATELGVDQILDAPFEDLAALSTPTLVRRARHVWTEQARVLAFVDALQAGRWAEAGALMTASHLSLREDYEVSCVELDVLVAEALARGALGARMTGGGFGGAALVLTRQEDSADVEAHLRAAFARNGWDAPTWYQVEASSGGTVVRA